MNNCNNVFNGKEKIFYKNKDGICTADTLLKEFNCRWFDLGSRYGRSGCEHQTSYRHYLKEIKNEQKD